MATGLFLLFAQFEEDAERTKGELKGKLGRYTNRQRDKKK